MSPKYRESGNYWLNKAAKSEKQWVQGLPEPEPIGELGVVTLNIASIVEMLLDELGLPKPKDTVYPDHSYSFIVYSDIPGITWEQEN
ncbi:MAG: hypothetical protein DWQ19_11565 [Crenarchaeota archaeon]|nr:MAG: hypothetical protein DWQ19_11565 [Thermoproteota archaeon]